MHPELEKTRLLIDDSLATYIPQGGGRESRILDAMRYMTLAPGKRVRSILLLEIASALGRPVEAFLPSACAVEFIHTASLILDDLPCMDDGKIRREQPTIHLAFNEYTAILAAVALLMQAFALISRNAEALDVPRPELIEMTSGLAQTIGAQGMIAGQYLDLASEDLQLNGEAVEYIRDHKTTLLFKSAATIALTLARAASSEWAVLSEYATCLGKAFQIADDVNDVVGDEKSLGKDHRKDARKCTSVDLFGIEGAKKEADRLVNQAIEQAGLLPRSNSLIILARYVEEQIG